jgi:HEAT repeat protein
MTVRLHALLGLGRMKYRPALAAVTRLLRDPSGGVRVNAVAVLGKVGEAKALVRALRDPEWYVRLKACEICGELRVKAALPALRKLVRTDSRKGVRAAALRAMDVIAGKNVK